MGQRSTFVITKDVHTKPGQEGYVLCMGVSALGLPNAALQKDAQAILSTEESVKGILQISEPAV